MSRRNYFIRTIGTLAGDFAVGFTMALACTWVIEGAALGVFFGFLLWLVAIFVGLALSQHVVHPVAATLLADRKLDDGIAAVEAAARSASDAAQRLWRWFQQHQADPHSSALFTWR
jgi:hypothetical protein